MKENHELEKQQFKEGATRRDLHEKAMTVEIVKLEATLKQVRKEKQITEMLCANLTNNNSEPLIKLVDSLGKTVAQFETVNQKFMPTLKKINHNINEISLIRDRITVTKEERYSVEKRIMYLIDTESGSTASKSAAPNELDSLKEQAMICTHTEERDSKQLLDLTELTNKLQQQLTQDVNSLDFYFKNINKNYGELLKRMEMEKANESFVKTVTETGDIGKAKQNVITTLKSSTIHQRKPALIRSHEVLTQEVNLRNLSLQLSPQIETNIPIKISTINEEVD
jgi:hypothetical protein